MKNVSTNIWWFSAGALCLGMVLLLGGERATVRADVGEQSKYILRSVALGKGFQCARVDMGSGDGWIVAGGYWRKVVDPQPISPGVYEVQVIADVGTNTCQVLRTEQTTGKLWFLLNGKWQLIEDGK